MKNEEWLLKEELTLNGVCALMVFCKQRSFYDILVLTLYLAALILDSCKTEDEGGW